MPRRSLRHYVKRSVGIGLLALGASIWLPLWWRLTGAVARARLIRYHRALTRANPSDSIPTIDFPIDFYRRRLVPGLAPSEVAGIVGLTGRRRISSDPRIAFADDFGLPLAPGRKAELTVLYDANGSLVRFVARNLAFDLGPI